MKKNKLQWTEIYTSFQGEGIGIGRPSFFVRFSPCNLRCANCDTKFSAYEIDTKEQNYGTVEVLLSKMKELSRLRKRRPNEFLGEEKWHPSAVIFTGGEPLIQPHNLLEELCRKLMYEHGTHITFETNGTVLPSDKLMKFVDFWSVSPKPETTAFVDEGKVRWDEEVIRGFSHIYRAGAENVQLKFVINNDEEIGWLKEKLEEIEQIKAFQIPVVLQADNQVSPEEEAPWHNPDKSLHQYLYRSEWLLQRILEDPFWGEYNVRSIMQQHRILWGAKRGV
jgi:7-carboxy-7-deazaguanine synthase